MARSGCGRWGSALLIFTALGTPAISSWTGQEPGDNARPEASARFEGVATPGRRIILKGDRSSGRDLHHRWIQTSGAAAKLEGADSPEASLVVPEGEESLGFLLVVGNGRGIDSAPLTIPVGPAGREASLRADAGDDLVGFVGRQVTLNGVRSEPSGRIGYRWIQAGGPQVTLKLESGCFYTFVPAAPGNYQFALVVASGDRISEADYVGVAVAVAPVEPTPPPPTPALIQTAGPATPPAVAPSPPVSTADLTLAAVRSIEGGPELSSKLAQVFADVSGRMDVFKRYEEAYSELSRRLDILVPRAERVRTIWTEKLFVPLTVRMIDSLREEGLDLAREDAQAAQLTAEQKARLAEHFQAMAEGFGRANQGPNGPKRLDGRPGR